MADREALEPGQMYFTVLYVDDQLQVPEIDTLIYLGPTTLDVSRETVYLFQYAESYYTDGNWNQMTSEGKEQYEQPPVTFFDDSSLYLVVDADGLMSKLQDWRARMP